MEGTLPASLAQRGATHRYIYWSSSLFFTGDVTSDSVSAICLSHPSFPSMHPVAGLELCLGWGGGFSEGGILRAAPGMWAGLGGELGAPCFL